VKKFSLRSGNVIASPTKWGEATSKLRLLRRPFPPGLRPERAGGGPPRKDGRWFFQVCYIFLLVFLISGPVSAEDLPPLPAGPLILTSVRPEQLSANYWINRLPDPDLLLKSPQEIKEFNEDIHREIKEAVDVFALDTKRPGGPIRSQIKYEYETVKKRKLFGADDQRIPQSFFDANVLPLLRWEKIPASISMRWGAAVRATAVRALPTDKKMLEAVGDYEFDQIQYTQIKLWTPVGIFHTSSDGKWHYVQGPYTRGWVRAKDIALFPTRAELKKYVKPESASFLVVTGESIRIFSDTALAELDQKASMGTILPLSGERPNAYAIWMPRAGVGGKAVLERAYVSKKSDVSTGFVPFTQRNIIRQAFKLLGARYGWAGMYNGRDCSGFTHDVFLTFGLDMPRGSKEQGYVGAQIDHFGYKEDTERKLARLQNAIPGITLLRMPKHQMLYLGQENGQYYVIHCTWAERVSMTSDQKLRINQVVVSDLTLNGQSYLGSLFDRIISMNEFN